MAGCLRKVQVALRRQVGGLFWVYPRTAPRARKFRKAAGSRGTGGRANSLYTGGLENCPALVEKLCRLRTRWGNGADVLRQVRSPALVAERLARAGVACPEVRLKAADIPARGRWLVKPRDGAGGRGIAFVADRAAVSRRRHAYF